MMKKIMQDLKEKELISYIVIFLTTLLVSYPLIKLQIRDTHDGFLHLLRLIGTNESIKNGEFPFLIVPYFCKNFGYAMNIFYPPLVTYIPLIFKIFTSHFYDALKIYAMVTTLFSGIFMYHFVKEVSKNKSISLLASILYIIAPYRLEDIYTRFAIGEFTAFVFIPLVFQGIYNLIHGNGKKHYYIALGAIGLVFSHSITTVYTALFCIFYIAFYFKKFFKKEILKKCIANVIIILLITACFTIPLIEHKLQTDYTIMIPEIMGTNADRASNCTIDFWQFFKDKGEENGVSFIVGIPILIGLLLTPFTFKSRKKEEKEFMIIFLLFSLISFIMCTNVFPWQIAPIFLTFIQFPWRMLTFALFFIIPVCAINFHFLSLQLKSSRWQICCYGLIITMILGFTILKLDQFQYKGENEDFKYEESILNQKQISHWQVNRDYLPYKAFKVQSSYFENRKDHVYILEGKVEINKEIKQALSMSFDIENATKGTKLELPYLYYLGYNIRLKTQQGEEILLPENESPYGFIQIELPKDIEKGTIVVKYQGTTLEKIAFGISLISSILFISWIIYKNRKNKGERNCD